MKNTEHNNSPSAPYFKNSDVALDKVALSAHRVVDNVAEAAVLAARKVGPTADRAAEFAHQAVDNAAAAVAPAAEWLDDQAQELKATQKKLINDTRNYVAANPLTSLVMALAAGFVVSRIIR
jgi:ElaB/YqjD/DUF883 family membrane-anchored ribosome-binding protein